jgi:hypothetical protein
MVVNGDSEYQVLYQALRRTQGFGLFFVECPLKLVSSISQTIQQDYLQDHLHNPVLALDLAHIAQTGTLLKAVREAVHHYGEIAIVLLHGLDAALAQTSPQAAISPVLVHLNQQRDMFRDCFSTRFVLFGSPAAMTQLMRQAPDFFDWRSGWFRF